MAKKEYPYGSKTPITEHFHSSEFDEKVKRHDKNHDTIVDTDLPTFLETLRSNKNISKITINSGYRCKEYNLLIGGASNSAHIDGKGADIVVYDKNGKKMLSKDVCLLLEDMGFKGGVGYRSGGNIYETHVDIKNRKSYFDEGTKPYKYFNSFYTYFGIAKFTTGTYKAESNMYVREKPSILGRIKKVKELNKTMQKALTSTNQNALAVAAKGHTFTASEIVTEPNGRVWFRNLNNGYICLKGIDGKAYFTKIK